MKFAFATAILKIETLCMRRRFARMSPINAPVVEKSRKVTDNVDSTQLSGIVSTSRALHADFLTALILCTKRERHVHSYLVSRR